MKGCLTFILLLILVGGGYYYYTQHKAALNGDISNATTAENTVVATTTSGIDAAIQTAVKSVGPASLLYYTNNRNYGVSQSQNICQSGSIGTIISGIEQYTKSVSCVVNPNFPSTSFTLVVSSLANSGEYYCTDQNGSESLISGIASGSSFKAGLSCK